MERLEKLTANRPSGSAFQPLSARGDDRAVPRRDRPGQAGESRESGSSMPDRARRWSCRFASGRGHEQARRTASAEEQPGGAVGGPEARHSIWPTIHPQILTSFASTTHDHLLQLGRLAERLANKLNELARGAGSGTSRFACPRAAGRHRRGAQGGGCRRSSHQFAGARYRHGCRGPGDPGRVAVERRQRVATRRPRRPPGREPSRGIFFPKYRGDLLETAVVTARMHAGAIEETKLPATRWMSWPSRSWQ